MLYLSWSFSLLPFKTIIYTFLSSDIYFFLIRFTRYLIIWTFSNVNICSDHLTLTDNISWASAWMTEIAFWWICYNLMQWQISCRKLRRNEFTIDDRQFRKHILDFLYPCCSFCKFEFPPVIHCVYIGKEKLILIIHVFSYGSEKIFKNIP